MAQGLTRTGLSGGLSNRVLEDFPLQRSFALVRLDVIERHGHVLVRPLPFERGIPRTVDVLDFNLHLTKRVQKPLRNGHFFGRRMRGGHGNHRQGFNICLSTFDVQFLKPSPVARARTNWTGRSCAGMQRKRPGPDRGCNTAPGDGRRWDSLLQTQFPSQRKGRNAVQGEETDNLRRFEGMALQRCRQGQR
jgi:hypothetical protein